MPRVDGGARDRVAGRRVDHGVGDGRGDAVRGAARRAEARADVLADDAALGEDVHTVRAVRRERAGRLLGDDPDGAARRAGRARSARGGGRGRRRRAGLDPLDPLELPDAAAVVPLASLLLDAQPTNASAPAPPRSMQHAAAVDEGRQVEGETAVVVVAVAVGGGRGCGGHGSILAGSLIGLLGVPGSNLGTLRPAPISSRTDMIGARLGRGQPASARPVWTHEDDVVPPDAVPGPAGGLQPEAPQRVGRHRSRPVRPGGHGRDLPDLHRAARLRRGVRVRRHLRQRAPQQRLRARCPRPT